MDVKGGVEQMRWALIEELFHAASEVPPERRTALLEADGRLEEEEIAEVLSLLSAEGDVAARVEAGAPAEGDDGGEDPWMGRRVGPFALRALLGQGGMGRVYRGEREDGSFEQVVAVKLLAQLLPSAMMRAQFAEECAALARLEHRNIARLVDGGVTGEGLPWLAMEFIEGQRLDRRCDAVAAGDGSGGCREVVGYGMQLCAAVQYVHRNLVLHRDLKPGNVMVTDAGEVKLLDFGTIKALESGAAASAATTLGLRALTLRYASPEHLRGEVLTTASDVFSLGMTLYRVLLGRLPEEWGEPGSEGYFRALRERGVLPVRAELERRWRIPASLARDLEAILAKALQWRAEDRYQEAEALRADLAAALESRPVAARASQPGELLAKFARRNRSMLLLGGVGVVVLAAALVAVLHENRVAREAEATVERELATEGALNHFLLVDFFELLKQIPGSTAAQRNAVSEGLAYSDRLAGLSSRRDLQLDRVQAYTEMGALEGDPYENNLDDAEGGVKTLTKAVALAHELSRANPGDAAVRRAEAAAQHALGETLFGMGKPAEAQRYLVPAAETMQELADGGRLDGPGLAAAAAFANSVGDLLYLEGAVSLGDRAGSIAWAKRSLALEEKGLAVDVGCARCRRGKSVEQLKLGMAEADPAVSLREFADGLRTLEWFPPAEQRTARVQRLDTLLRQRMGWAEMQLGRTAEGLAVLQEMRRRMQDAIAHDPMDARARFDLVALDFTLAEGLETEQHAALVEELGRETLEQTRTLLRRDPANQQMAIHEADAEQMLAAAERVEGRKPEAAALLDRAAERMVGEANKPDADASVMEGAAETLVLARQKGALAVQYMKKAMGDGAQATADEWTTLAEAEALAGEQTAARESARRAMGLVSKRPTSLNRQRLVKRVEAVLREGVPGTAGAAAQG